MRSSHRPCWRGRRSSKLWWGVRLLLSVSSSSLFLHHLFCFTCRFFFREGHGRISWQRLESDNFWNVAAKACGLLVDSLMHLLAMVGVQMLYWRRWRMTRGFLWSEHGAQVKRPKLTTSKRSVISIWRSWFWIGDDHWCYISSVWSLSLKCQTGLRGRCHPFFHGRTRRWQPSRLR